MPDRRLEGHRSSEAIGDSSMAEAVIEEKVREEYSLSSTATI
jgi:hypothetical protein